jgi:LPXTG-motif cell wall-anchored protein
MVAFWVIPWKLLILIALIIAAGVLGYLYFKKKNNPPTQKDPAPEQPETSHIENANSES